ncbi:MAG TPA: flagellar basal body-associated FliL family protein [Jatrophihabitans sp.]|jgi:flagellar FliL protein
MTATTGRESRFQSPGGSSGRPSGGAFGKQGGSAPTEPAAAPPAKTSRMSKKTIIIVLVLVLVVAGAAYKFAKPKPPYKPSGGDVVVLDAQTLNLAGGHYLKVGVSVQLLKGKAKIDNFDISEASELVIEEFSNKTVDSLASNGARNTLKTELLANMKKAYPDEIWQVYVTQFVTQ